MNRFTLRLVNKEAEAEYTKLKSGKISENIKIVLFFLACIQFTSGIPSLVNENYLGFGLSTGVVILMILISLFGNSLNKYKQFIAFIILVVFHCTRPFFLPQEFAISKEQILLRGYNFANLQIPLIIRFPEWNQKIFGIILSFLLRFILTGLIENKIYDLESIIRNIMTCLFMAYIFYSNEKAERQVFQSHYDSREKLAKFKQLVVNYLPQSLAILNSLTNKYVFANKAFLSFFNDNGADSLTYESFESLPSLTHKDKLDIQLDLLKVEKGTIREVGILEPSKDFLNVMTFKQFLDQVIANRSVENKALSLSASCVFNSNYHLFEVIVTKIKWDQNDSIAIILNDITYQQKLLSLKISNENKDKIIATVSHELRTPLNGIIGILDIAETKITQPEVIEYLDLCKDNAKLLLGLVNSILDIQQIRQGKLKLNITKVNIRKVLKDITRLFKFQCKQKDIYLKLDISQEVPESVHTDENRLKQVLINLVGNAIKFTSQGGITVGIGQDPKREECLRIWVSDTGIGIKEEDKGKLFKMYSKLKDGESVNGNGVGLGLMISNALAVLLGDKADEKGIEVESTYGKGTKFEFSIYKNPSKPLFQETNMDTLQIPHDKSQQNRRKSFSDKQNSEDSLIYPEDTKEADILESARSRIAYHTFTRLTTLSQGPHLILETEENAKSTGSVETKPIKLEILVVDDNPFNIMAVENLLHTMGLQMKKAKSGMEAIEEVKAISKESGKFRVILMDCNMPIMDGYEATRILKKMMSQGEVNKMPIVAFTASDAEEDIKKCFECGMNDYLMKPLLADDLNRVLSKLNSNLDEF